MTFRLALLCIFFSSATCLMGNDTTILTAADFLQMVKQNHPTALRAQLIADRAEAGLLRARGAFDPQAYGSTNWKQLDDKEYYRQWEAGIQAPIWPGMRLEAGYENNTGAFINPETSTVNNGLLFAGISVPLLRGLTTDERRIAVKRSRLEILRANEEQNLRLNDLILDAAYAYWSWWLSYQLREVQASTLAISYDRWQFSRNVFLLGDIAAIDTLEAYVQWQSRKVELQRAQVQYIRASYRLSTFLWDEEGNPLFLNEQVVPEQLPESKWKLELAKVQQLDGAWDVQQHPRLLSLKILNQQQDLDIRLQKEMLKPQLDLKYNFLTTPSNNESLSLRDYRWGAKVSLPLAYRRQRANIQLAKIGQMETNFQLQEQNLNLSANRSAIKETVDQVSDNLQMFGSITTNFSSLLSAEQEKFNLGESTVFLVNARENQYLQSMQNWYHLHYELISQLYLWQWYLGDIGE